MGSNIPDGVDDEPSPEKQATAIARKYITQIPVEQKNVIADEMALDALLFVFENIRAHSMSPHGLFQTNDKLSNLHPDPLEAFYMNDNGEKTTIRYHRSVSDFKDNPHLGDIVKSKDGNCSIYIKGGNIHGQLYCDEIYLGELDGMSTEREMDHYGIL